MDKLAKQQACQLFIEQEIEKGLAAGKTKYAIGHEIAAWIKKFFEADVKPSTIEKRAQRVAENLQTNVCTEQTHENYSETEETTEEPIVNPTPRLGPPRNGMRFARLAIMDLDKITDKDLERENAFKLVIEYIKKRREKK